jgi:hypothetical protein
MVTLFMAELARNATTKPPKERRDGKTFFYPAEVVRILGLEGIDYSQLRRILRMVRPPGPATQPADRKWSRYEFEDLVAVRAAVRLAGGEEALEYRRHLLLGELECACRNLRALGIARPLTEVPLEREGSQILARLDGLTFRPADGQLAWMDTYNDARQYLQEALAVTDFPFDAVRNDIKETRIALREHSKQGRRAGLSKTRRSRLTGGRIYYETLEEARSTSG